MFHSVLDKLLIQTILLQGTCNVCQNNKYYILYTATNCLTMCGNNHASQREIICQN